MSLEFSHLPVDHSWNIRHWWIRFLPLGRLLLTDVYLFASVFFPCSLTLTLLKERLKLGPMSSSMDLVWTFICQGFWRQYFWLKMYRNNILWIILKRCVIFITLLISDTSMLSRPCAHTSCVTSPPRSSQTRTFASVVRSWRTWSRLYSRCLIYYLFTILPTS